MVDSPARSQYPLQVNRSLRAITMTKQLWISLVNDLRTRSLIETPPSTLSQYTTAQLIGQVRAVVVGPQTWRRDMPNEQPLLAEEITVLLGRPVSERNLTVRLINDGRQVHSRIARSPGNLGCHR
jgi:hypothetical protein